MWESKFKLWSIRLSRKQNQTYSTTRIVYESLVPEMHVAGNMKRYEVRHLEFITRTHRQTNTHTHTHTERDRQTEMQTQGDGETRRAAPDIIIRRDKWFRHIAWPAWLWSRWRHRSRDSSPQTGATGLPTHLFDHHLYLSWLLVSHFITPTRASSDQRISVCV